MKTIRFRVLAALLMLFLCLCLSQAVAEISLSFSPEAPRMGDYVDVTVTTDREGAQSVRYDLSTPEGKVFSGEETSHFSASFRPRQESSYTLTVAVSYGKKDTETASVIIPVAGAAPVQQGADVVYQQKDGWWKSKSYNIRTVEKAGCALFALSHALQRMGFEGEDVLPDALGITYANCYIEERGTANERLLTLAGAKYDFLTEDELNESAKDIAACLRRGDYFSFSIVIGHIALADGVSEDGSKIHIVDSAPGATYERIKKGTIYYREEDGSFHAAATPDQLPGIRWFFETGEYGGMTYWLDASYCARRGMRLIRPQWLKLKTESGSENVSFDYPGTMVSRVVLNGEETRVPTASLIWATRGAEETQLAVVTASSGAAFQNAEGKNIPGYLKIKRGTLLPVLETGKDTCYVYYKGTCGYVSSKKVDLLPVQAEGYREGIISVNGRTSGTSTVKIRAEASGKSRQIGEWKIGTPVAIAEEKGNFFLAEGKGIRGWVENKYLTLEEGAEDDGQKVDKGE